MKATLDLKDEIKETLTEQAEVQAFDKNLNKLMWRSNLKGKSDACCGS